MANFSRILDKPQPKNLASRLLSVEAYLYLSNNQSERKNTFSFCIKYLRQSNFGFSSKLQFRASLNQTNPVCFSDVCRVPELHAGMTKQRLDEKGISSINTPTNDVYLVDTTTEGVVQTDTVPPVRIGVTDSMAGNCKHILSTMIYDIPMNVDL